MSDTQSAVPSVRVTQDTKLIYVCSVCLTQSAVPSVRVTQDTKLIYVCSVCLTHRVLSHQCALHKILNSSTYAVYV